MQTIPLLLDTDPGSDIDDAVAISYLLRQPACEFLGITTVSGDVAKRASIADALCHAAGRHDVPIHAGAAGPLWFGPGQPNVPHHDALGDAPHRSDFRPNEAVEFLRHAIRARPGEITLLTIGPLTNIAILFTIDPQIPSLLKRIVSMAGYYFSDESNLEWNCLVDPLAASIVFAARPPEHICFGLDVTLKCKMPADQVRRRFSSHPLLLKMAEKWFAQTDQITFHDPLAAASIFHPELCAYDEGSVTISLDPHAEKSGNTIFRPNQSPTSPHRIAKTVNSSAFFSEYFSVVP